MSEGFDCFPAAGRIAPILENAEISTVSPAQLDDHLATGWRHFGSAFFRYNFALQGKVICGVVPLRIRVADFQPTKSQRRVLRKNADLEMRIVPTKQGEDYDRLFEKHRTRFTEHVPDSLRDFLSDNPGESPCLNVATELRLGSRLIAVSFLDIGHVSVSSVYAAFDPEHSARSLGVLTFLLEAQLARAQGKPFHYLGYAYTVPSVYDYKKAFKALEGYDWGRCWRPMPENFTWSRPFDAIEEPA